MPCSQRIGNSVELLPVHVGATCQSNSSKAAEGEEGAAG